MTNVSVNLNKAGSWKKPCLEAVSDLNSLFKKHKVNISLTQKGSKDPSIQVRIDASIKGITHGTTRTMMRGGRLWHSEVGLPSPEKVIISTPAGVRRAGNGILEVIAAHELVHALGHTVPAHNSHLMAQTLEMDYGDSAAGDKARVVRVVDGKKKYGATMPALQLSPASVAQLKKVWK